MTAPPLSDAVFEVKMLAATLSVPLELIAAPFPPTPSATYPFWSVMSNTLMPAAPDRI